MTRGRKRKVDPTMPAHIAQGSIPRGVYWDGRAGGRWYVFERDDAGKAKSKTVAGRDALLSDLHAIVESRSDKAAGTLAWLCDEFEQSPNFKKLASTTQDSYRKARKVACSERTKQGGTVGELQARRFTRPVVQRLIDRIAAGHRRGDDGELIPTPTKAVHVLRYLSVMFRWGANRGHCESSPAEGIEAPIERKQSNMPTSAAFARIVEYSRHQARPGRGLRGQKNTCPPYLWAVAEITYLCRLRGIESTTLSDANILEEGLLSNRRKGSRDNITAWSPRLRAAVDHLVAHRKTTWNRLGKPLPLNPANRPLVVSADGNQIQKSAFDSAWQRMILAAIADGAIALEERFSLHGLKHRGVTDTQGTKPEKQLASGHVSAAMLDRYDHAIPLVKPAG